MKKYLSIILIILLVSCSNSKGLNKQTNIIAYKLPFKVEQLLLKQIEAKPKPNYCLLLDEKNDIKEFILVTGYSYYHKNTSYRALIGEKYYPISFSEFDRRYGVVTSAKEFLRLKIRNENPKTSFGKQSYPMYHGMYKIEVDSKNDIIFEGNIY